MAATFITTGSFPVLTDPDVTLESAVAVGRYVWSNPDFLTTTWPPESLVSGRKLVGVASFGRTISTGECREAFRAEGVEPVTVRAFLALAAVHPALQLHHHLVALGSVGLHRMGYPVVAILGILLKSRSDRMLDLDFGNDRQTWPGFAAFPYFKPI